MSRLPQPGSDDGTWGNILNDFLSQVHNSDGSLKANSVTASVLAPNAVTAANLTTSSGNNGDVLTVDNSLTSGFKWATPTGGTVSPATTSALGTIQLAGDLGGTATAPTVPGLAAKYTKPASGIPAADLDSSSQSALSAAATAVQSVNSKSGTNVTLTAADVSALDQTAADARYLQKSNNLSDVTAASTARANLSAEQSLTPVAVLSAATYTAVAGDFIPVDTSSNAITITLPTAPADNTRIAVKIIHVGGTLHAVSVVCGGTDVFNETGGVTSLSLSVLNQTLSVRYETSAAIWYVETESLPLSELDSRYSGATTVHTLSATADCVTDTNAYCAPGSANVASTAGLYTAGMVGKTAVFIQGGSGGTSDLVTTVQSVTDSNHLVLAASVPGGTGNPQTLIIGTDVTSQIQTAVTTAASTNLPLYIPTGSYLKTATVTVPSNLKIIGDGRELSYIVHAASTTDGISGVDLTNVVFEDWSLNGPGQGIGTGNGVNFTLSAQPATYYPTMRRFSANRFGVDGIAIATPIIGRLDQVVPFLNGRHGINLYGAGAADGTSMDLTACFPAGNWGAGYHLKQMAYSSLTGCAADANGVSYFYDTCIGITESGCGSEETYDFQLLGRTTFTPNGLSRYIFNSKVVLSSPYMINNVGTSCYITNLSKVVINDYYEGSPGNASDPNSNPTVSLKVDSGCSVIVNNYQNVTAMSLAGGSTVLLPDDIQSLQAASSTSPDQLTSGQNTIPRYNCGSAVSMGASQSMRLTYFTASVSGTFTQLKTISSTTAAGATPSLCKMGLYSVDASGNGTLVASTASDTTLWSAANTVYTSATQASYTVTKGQRYALAVLVVTAAAVPTVVGASMAGSAAANATMAESPRLAGALNGQSDLPASFTDASLTGVASVFYGEIVP